MAAGSRHDQPWGTHMSTRRSALMTLLVAASAFVLLLGGGAVAVAAPTVPTAPTRVAAATNAAARTATITWAPPTRTGGSSITGYAVARDGVDSDGDGPWSTIIGSRKRTFTFNDLVPGRSYALTVRAVTRRGLGAAASKVVSIPVPTLPGVPIPTERFISMLWVPAPGGGVPTGEYSAALNWAPPTVTGGLPIIAYVVARSGYDKDGTGPWSTTLSASARSFTFLRLGPIGYTVTVSAITAAGIGPAASVSAVIEGPGVFPQPAANLAVVTDRAAGTATLTWTLGFAGAHGSPPDRFAVGRDGVDRDGSGPWSTTLPADARSFTFRDLKVGTTYTLSVNGYFLWNPMDRTQTIQVTL